jgi:flagellar biosynthesis protein FlhB
MQHESPNYKRLFSVASVASVASVLLILGLAILATLLILTNKLQMFCLKICISSVGSVDG